MRQPIRQQAGQQLARTAVTTPRVAKATQEVGQQLASVSRLAAPTESLWYRLKKTIIEFFSTIDIGSRKVHAVTSDMAQRVLPQMQPGDILLRRTDGSSGNLFIPSWWKHAAVYVGDGTVVEATFEGVKRTRLDEFFAHGDHATVLRGKDLSDVQRRAVARYASAQEGKPYDFDMAFDDDARLACTELAYHALKAGTGQEVVQQNWMGAVVGDDFLTDRFEVVYTSAPDRMAD